MPRRSFYVRNKTKFRVCAPILPALVAWVALRRSPPCALRPIALALTGPLAPSALNCSLSAPFGAAGMASPLNAPLPQFGRLDVGRSSFFSVPLADRLADSNAHKSLRTWRLLCQMGIQPDNRTRQLMSMWGQDPCQQFPVLHPGGKNPCPHFWTKPPYSRSSSTARPPRVCSFALLFSLLPGVAAPQFAHTGPSDPCPPFCTGAAHG